jgi:hypothetical protein
LRYNAKSSFNPHLRHAVIIGDGVVRTRRLDLKLTHKTFQQWVRSIVDGISIGVMKKRNGDLFIKVIPFITIILAAERIVKKCQVGSTLEGLQ